MARWAAAGALWCLSVLGILSIGIFVAPVAVATTVWAWRASAERRVLVAGVPIGAAVMLLAFAPVLASNAGCSESGSVSATSTSTGTEGCGDVMPWPVVGLAVLLAAFGSAAYWLLVRRRGTGDARSRPDRRRLPEPQQPGRLR